MPQQMETENSTDPQKDKDQAAQSTQQQTRPSNPHNNKPGRPNPTNENKTKILEKFENKHKTKIIK